MCDKKSKGGFCQLVGKVIQLQLACDSHNKGNQTYTRQPHVNGRILTQAEAVTCVMVATQQKCQWYYRDAQNCAARVIFLFQDQFGSIITQCTHTMF